MSRLFISHSGSNDDCAIALRDWLVREGWSGPDDIFLDLDPERGIAAGQRWAHALEDAATRCEAVLFLVSEDWLRSKWCGDEYQLASKLNKKLFALLLDDIAFERLPGGLTAQWQIVRLKGEPAERFLTVHPLTSQQSPVYFANAGLVGLKRGLDKAGIGTETFELQPDQNGPFGWRAPYRGLEALEPEDAAVLFGRGADIVRGIDTLRGLATHKPPRLLVILGASGAGKSSFLRAGIWPRLLRDDSQWLPLRTVRTSRGGAIEGNEGLLTALEDVHRRFALAASRADLREHLATPEAFVALLHELRRAGAKRALISAPPFPLPVLCLDQGEEIFGAGAAPESEKFLQLARAAIDADAALFLVTIRSDSYDAMQGSRALAGIDQATLSLGPVPPGEIAHVIREPAEILRRKAGLVAPLFDAAVIERLEQEIEGEVDALPLLAFVLQRLMREHQGVALIGINELNHTGGVAAAIESAAEAALDDAGIGRDWQKQREELRRLFIPRLARIDRESKAPLRRVARQSEVPSDLLPLAHALTERRLLVVKLAAELEGGEAKEAATLEVAHEALLRRWPTLADLLTEDRDALLLLDGVLSASADWEKAEAARKPDYLAHRGSRLADAQALASRGPDWEREVASAKDYLAACAARDAAERDAKEAALAREQAQVARTRKFQRRMTWSLGALLLAVLAIMAGALWESYATSKREAAAFASESENASQQGLCDQALRLAVAGLPPQQGAWPLDYKFVELPTAIANATSQGRCPFIMALTGDTGPVRTAVFSPDGTRVLTASADQTARIWDAKTGALLAPPLGTLATNNGQPGTALTAALYTADGKRIVKAAFDGVVTVWDAGSNQIIKPDLFPCKWYSINGNGIALSPDGNHLVAACSSNNMAGVLDLTTGNALKLAHDDDVNSAAYNASGTQIVTASKDKTARIWDAASGALLFKLTGHTDSVYRAAFSPDGTRVVTASLDHTARVWNAATGTLLYPPLSEHTGQVTSAAFSPDGKRIVTASQDKTARLWDAATGAPMATLTGHTNLVITAVFSPDGSRIATASWDNTARLWDGTTGAALATFAGHTGEIYGATFSPDGSTVVTASLDETARLWAVATVAPIAVLPGFTVNGIVPSADGTRVLTTSLVPDATAGVWDLATRTMIVKIAGRFGASAFSLDGKRIVSAVFGVGSASSGTAQPSNVAATPVGATQPPSTTTQPSTAVQPSNGGAQSSGTTGQPPGNAPTPTTTTQPSSGTAQAPNAAPQPSTAPTQPADGTALIWDAATGSPVVTLTAPRAGLITQVAFSADGTRVLARCSDTTVRVFDATTGQLLHTLGASGQDSWILYLNYTVSFSADGSRAIVRSARNSVQVWDVTTGAKLSDLKDPPSLVGAAISPDGKRVATGSIDKMARVWDAMTGQLVLTLQGHTDTVYTAQFSPDGGRIVTTSADHTARTWDARTGAAIATLSGHAALAGLATFSADGAHVLTTSSDGSAIIWDPESGPELFVLSAPFGVASFGPRNDQVFVVGPIPYNSVRIWQLDQSILLKPAARVAYVCEQRLQGAQSFTDTQMQDPILRGHENLRTPCQRVGPLNFDYYRLAIKPLLQPELIQKVEIFIVRLALTALWPPWVLVIGSIKLAIQTGLIHQ